MKTVLRDRKQYPHFPHEKTEAQRGCKLSKVIYLMITLKTDPRIPHPNASPLAHQFMYNKFSNTYRKNVQIPC